MQDGELESIRLARPGPAGWLRLAARLAHQVLLSAGGWLQRRPARQSGRSPKLSTRGHRALAGAVLAAPRGKAPRPQGQGARTPAYWDGPLRGVAGMIPEFMWSPRVLVSLLILRKRNHIFLESSKDTRTPIELVNHTASPSYWASPISEDPCWSSLSARTQGPQAISITVWARFRMGPPNDHASHEQRRSRGHLSHAAAMLSVNPLHN